jgi:hypothetical protein
MGKVTMPWPKIIAHGGRGSNRGPVPRPSLVPRPKSELKRAFMQEAVLAMLKSPNIMSIEHLADNAETLYYDIEKRVDR